MMRDGVWVLWLGVGAMMLATAEERVDVGIGLWISVRMAGSFLKESVCLLRVD